MMEKYDIIITSLSAMWVFLLGWVLKINKDIGKMRQNDLQIMTDLIEMKNGNMKFVHKSECSILHANNADNLRALKDDINQQLKEIKDGQRDMQKDIKELLKSI
jgi:hypothetical protein